MKRGRRLAPDRHVIHCYSLHNREKIQGTYEASTPVFAMATQPNQIKSATDNNGGFSRENDDIQMAIQTPDYINNQLDEDTEKHDIRKELSKHLSKINKPGTTLIETEDGFYLVDHGKKDTVYPKPSEKRDGFGCRLRVIKKGLTEEEIQETKKEIENGNIRTQEDVDSWIKEYVIKQGRYNSDSIDAQNGASDNDNARLDIQTPQRESFREQDNRDSKENLGTGESVK